MCLLLRVCFGLRVRATTSLRVTRSCGRVIHENQVFEYMPPGAPIMSVSKGIETSTLMLMKDILKEICGQERSYAFLRYTMAVFKVDLLTVCAISQAFQK